VAADRPVRVLVCDDSLGFPALVGAWLEGDDRFDLAGTARDGAELVDLVQRVDADVLILDLVLPDVDDPSALVTAVRRHRPGLAVLLVSSLVAPELARAATAAGADSFRHKASTGPDLLDEVQRIARTDSPPPG
jgi:DNA-binding NarL/FixJ family response regulator